MFFWGGRLIYPAGTRGPRGGTKNTAWHLHLSHNWQPMWSQLAFFQKSPSFPTSRHQAPLSLPEQPIATHCGMACSFSNPPGCIATALSILMTPDKLNNAAQKKQNNNILANQLCLAFKISSILYSNISNTSQVFSVSSCWCCQWRTLKDNVMGILYILSYIIFESMRKGYVHHCLSCKGYYAYCIPSPVPFVTERITCGDKL